VLDVYGKVGVRTCLPWYVIGLMLGDYGTVKGTMMVWHWVVIIVSKAMVTSLWYDVMARYGTGIME